MHGEYLRIQTGDEELVGQIKKDYRQARIDAQTRAILEFAEKITRDATTITKDDIEHLRGLGLEDEQILEAAEVAGFFNYINRVADALGVEMDMNKRRAGAEHGAPRDGELSQSQGT